MVIAEFSHNHLGDFNILSKMIIAASRAGANFAKIQTFYADDLSTTFSDTRDRVKQAELTAEEHKQFVAACYVYNIVPMTSVYSVKYIPMLQQAGFRWIKIGSADVHKTDLIRAYKACSFNVIVSTGGQDLRKIQKIKPLEGVLHCVSKYPHDAYEANLCRMFDIRSYWGNVPIGFSDHSDPLSDDALVASKTAFTLGAEYVERHFTVLERHRTKDGKVSLVESQLRDLCDFERNRKEWPKETGLFRAKQSLDEINLIGKYQKRWREVL